MTNMEGQMASENLRKDLISVNILIKKHAVCHSVHTHACLYSVHKGKDWIVNEASVVCIHCTADLIHS